MTSRIVIDAVWFWKNLSVVAEPCQQCNLYCGFFSGKNMNGIRHRNVIFRKPLCQPSNLILNLNSPPSNLKSKGLSHDLRQSVCELIWVIFPNGAKYIKKQQPVPRFETGFLWLNRGCIRID